MALTRRQALEGLFAGGIVAQVPASAWANSSASVLALGNGMRVHYATNKSGYVSAALALRSKHIDGPRGLAHIMEHTSFSVIEEKSGRTRRAIVNWRNRHKRRVCCQAARRNYEARYQSNADMSLRSRVAKCHLRIMHRSKLPSGICPSSSRAV
jgi:hypothetical protein